MKMLKVQMLCMKTCHSKGNAGNICEEKGGNMCWETRVSASDPAQDDRSTDELIRSFT